MEKVYEFAFREFLCNNAAGEEFSDRIDKLFQPLCDRLKELVSEKDYADIEVHLVDLYIEAEVLAGVEGMKLVKGLGDGSIERIA